MLSSTKNGLKRSRLLTSRKKAFSVKCVNQEAEGAN